MDGGLRPAVFVSGVRRLVGAVRVAEVAAGLAGLGQAVTLVLRDPSAPPLRLPPGLPVVSLDDAGLTPHGEPAEPMLQRLRAEQDEERQRDRA